MKPKTKSEATRQRILEAATGLFQRRGFEAATMREIAAEAGMATGAAYYYFDSKDAIVLAFYERSAQEMEPLLQTALDGAKTLEQRIRALLEVKFTYFERNRPLLRALAGHTDPQHPLSPFSEQNRAIRERDMGYFERALTDSKISLPPDLTPILPGMLWMYQMGLILFWIYDRSEKQQLTRALIDQSAGAVAGLIRIAALPLLRPVRKRVAALVETVRSAA